MSKFGKLKGLEVTGSMTAEMTIYQIEGEPVLILSPATEANKPYFNAMLKVSRKAIRRAGSGNFTPASIAESRDNDRELFPRFVVRGWRNMEKLCGEDLPCTVENVREFLDSLPDWLFDEIRSFATDAQNFITVEFDAEETAGNSQEG